MNLSATTKGHVMSEKYNIRCGSCENDYMSQCDDDTGMGLDECPICGYVPADDCPDDDGPDWDDGEI